MFERVQGLVVFAETEIDHRDGQFSRFALFETLLQNAQDLASLVLLSQSSQSVTAIFEEGGGFFRRKSAGFINLNQGFLILAFEHKSFGQHSADMDEFRELIDDVANFGDRLVVISGGKMPGGDGRVNNRRKRIEFEGGAKFFKTFVHATAAVKVAPVPVVSSGVVRIRGYGLAEMLFGAFEIPGVSFHIRQDGVSLGAGGIQFERAIGSRSSERVVGGGFDRKRILRNEQISRGQAGMSSGVSRIFIDGLLIKLD